MTRKEFYSALSSRIPIAYSEAWDNDGAMLLSNPTRAVSRVLCTLDVSDKVIAYAKENSFDLILSHHPLIFGGVKALDGEDTVSRRILELVSADIAVFSFHTRLDAMAGGVNDALSEMFGLSAVTPLGEGEAALGRVGTLGESLPLEKFLDNVKSVLGAPALNVFKKTDTVRRVAVVGGEGKDFIAAAEKSGADTYLSGRLGYHAMIDGKINLIECGHYFTEKHAAKLLADIACVILGEVKIEIYTPNSLTVY